MPVSFAFNDLLTPGKDQGHKMVAVTGACKHGRYQRIWLQSFFVISNIKVFATEDGRPDSHTMASQPYNSQPASWANTTDYTDPYATHKDKKHLAHKMFILTLPQCEVTGTPLCLYTVACKICLFLHTHKSENLKCCLRCTDFVDLMLANDISHGYHAYVCTFTAQSLNYIVELGAFNLHCTYPMNIS